MIKLTGLGQYEFILNAEHIQTIESTPDTVITLMNGEKFVVVEPADVVIQLVMKYKRAIYGVTAPTYRNSER
jgi:flagellar protein FlbD